MRRAAILVVLLGVSFLGYRQVFAHGPVKVYEQFAEEMVHRRFGNAAKLSDGLRESDLAAIGNAGGIDPAMLQTLFASRFDIVSKDETADRTVTLKAVQTVLFNPPGVESAIRPAMYATLNQLVSLRKVSGDWKVTSFKSKLEKMDSLTSR